MSARPQRRGVQIPRLEWLFALLGAGLVFGTASFILYEGFTRGSSPPDIRVTVESVARLNESSRVVLRAVNRGDSTAADVKVEATLVRGGNVVETTELTFQYLPPNSERKGGVFFENDPRTGELKVRAKGYELP